MIVAVAAAVVRGLIIMVLIASERWRGDGDDGQSFVHEPAMVMGDG